MKLKQIIFKYHKQIIPNWTIKQSLATPKATPRMCSESSWRHFRHTADEDGSVMMLFSSNFLSPWRLRGVLSNETPS